MEAASGRNSIGHTGILRWIESLSLQRIGSGVETAPRAIVIAIHMGTFDFDTVSRQSLRALADVVSRQAGLLKQDRGKPLPPYLCCVAAPRTSPA